MTDPYDPNESALDVRIRPAGEHADGKRRLALITKEVIYQDGRRYLNLVLRSIDGRPGGRVSEVLVPQEAFALVRSVMDGAPETPVPLPAPAAAAPPPPSAPRVLALDAATRARLGVTTPTTRPQPERPRRVPPLPPAERRQLGLGGR